MKNCFIFFLIISLNAFAVIEKDPNNNQRFIHRDENLNIIKRRVSLTGYTERYNFQRYMENVSNGQQEEVVKDGFINDSIVSVQVIKFNPSPRRPVGTEIAYLIKTKDGRYFIKARFITRCDKLKAPLNMLQKFIPQGEHSSQLHASILQPPQGVVDLVVSGQGSAMLAHMNSLPSGFSPTESLVRFVWVTFQIPITGTDSSFSDIKPILDPYSIIEECNLEQELEECDPEQAAST